MATSVVRAEKGRLPKKVADPHISLVPNKVDDAAPSSPVTSISLEHSGWNGDVQPVAEQNVEESIRTKAIGDRIRRLRLKRSMGLVELGQRTGMSASFLSQLETGRVVPTLRNLSRIALVFGKDLSHFLLDDKKNQFKKSRAKDRIRLPIGDKSDPQFISESMSALIPDRSLVPCIAEFLPDSRNAVYVPNTFRGQEFVYVMRGLVTLSTENAREELSEGDVIWIDGSTKRQYCCKDGKPAAAMIITFPSRS
jgi:transcriptional regulator with XRE-family HTH domain